MPTKIARTRAAAEKGADIGEFSHRHDKKDKILSGGVTDCITGRQVEELRHEEEKPWNIDHAEESEGDRFRRRTTGGVAAKFP